MPNNVDKVLPSKYNRRVLDQNSQETLCMLYCKIYPNTKTDEVMVNSTIMKYGSLCFKGKTFSISKKNNIPYVVQAKWNENLFGSSPTPLPDSDIPTANIQPTNVKYYFNAAFTTKDTSFSLTFTYVLWLLPHPQRYSIGKPTELWHNSLYECCRWHSFLPIDRLICCCAHGVM